MNSYPTTFDLNKAVFALSDALDLVGVDEVHHGKRVGYMAYKLAEALGWSSERAICLLQLGLVHDCGVSSTEVHRHLLAEMQWRDADVHANLGADLLLQVPELANFSAAIRYHHTPWSELPGHHDLSEQDRLAANLIFLVDRVDALAASHYGVDILQALPAIHDRVVAERGVLFSPELVDAFIETSQAEAFWLVMESPHLERFIFETEAEMHERAVGAAQLLEVSAIFAYIVDAKSRFTYLHSAGVARLAVYLGELSGLPAQTLLELEIAGLLHDLGKLRVPDEVLDRPGRLSSDDAAVMHRHSFDTFQILRRISGLERVALWAAYHHEAPNGRGYPFHNIGLELTLEARIIAVADVFQALAQDRPYRKAMPLARILALMDEFAQQGELDADLVRLVQENAQACHARAVQEPTGHEDDDRSFGPYQARALTT